LVVGGGLRLSLQGAVTNAVVKDFTIGPGVMKDVRPTYSPRTQIAGHVSYEIPGTLFGGNSSADYSVGYVSGFYSNIRNFDAQWFNGRTLQDVAATWYDAGGHFSVGAYVKNLADVRYKTIGFDLSSVTGSALEAYGDPRTYGVRFGLKY
jgi:iron complex outermembrane receptor protein